MPACLISFGANLGDARGTIAQAVTALRQALYCQPAEFHISRFFNTPPVGGPAGQPPFVNAVAAVQTERTPWEVWQAVRQVEQELGRERMQRWEARRIDLDILLYDDLRIWTPQLKIPHPRMCMRRFILEPAADVAADWRDPVSGLRISELAESLRGSQANLVLCGERSSGGGTLLEEVARKAMARWQRIERTVQGFMIDNTEQSSRWVAWLPAEELANIEGTIPLHPQPKLLMYLSDKCDSDGAQWEDVHRQLAARMQLCESPTPTPGWSVAGPKYLLATRDREWAVHEIIAALEAMDCPVEPLR